MTYNPCIFYAKENIPAEEFVQDVMGGTWGKWDSKKVGRLQKTICFSSARSEKLYSFGTWTRIEGIQPDKFAEYWNERYPNLLVEVESFRIEEDDFSGEKVLDEDGNLQFTVVNFHPTMMVRNIPVLVFIVFRMFGSGEEFYDVPKVKEGENIIQDIMDCGCPRLRSKHPNYSVVHALSEDYQVLPMAEMFDYLNNMEFMEEYGDDIDLMSNLRQTPLWGRIGRLIQNYRSKNEN